MCFAFFPGCAPAALTLVFGQAMKRTYCNFYSKVARAQVTEKRKLVSRSDTYLKSSLNYTFLTDESGIRKE